MKYAKKMMVVPYSTPVGSSADAQNVNMSATLLKNIPKNDKNKLYLQSLSKLREMAETLAPEDKFKDTVTKLIQNIEEEIKKDNVETEDLQAIEKQELQEDASKKIKDYSLSNPQPTKTRKYSKKGLKRELKNLNVNNIISDSDKPFTRSQNAQQVETNLLVRESQADNALKQPTSNTILPSNQENNKSFDFQIDKITKENLLNDAINDTNNDEFEDMDIDEEKEQLKNKLNNTKKLNKSIIQDNNRLKENFNNSNNLDKLDPNIVNNYAKSQIREKFSSLINNSIDEFGSENVTSALNNFKFWKNTPKFVTKRLKNKRYPRFSEQPYSRPVTSRRSIYENRKSEPTTSLYTEEQ